MKHIKKLNKAKLNENPKVTKILGSAKAFGPNYTCPENAPEL